MILRNRHNCSLCTEPGIKDCTWLREISSCSCLAFLPGPAWLLLIKICTPFSRLISLHCRIILASSSLCWALVIGLLLNMNWLRRGDGEWMERKEMGRRSRFRIVSEQARSMNDERSEWTAARIGWASDFKSQTRVVSEIHSAAAALVFIICFTIPHHISYERLREQLYKVQICL